MLLGLALAAGAPAQVVQRQLPTQGKRGELGAPLALPMVRIGQETLRLAPGGVIYDQSNRAILHGALPAGDAVWYTIDGNGNVERMYMLTPAEQAMLDRNPRR